jgi:hypothetical protein
MMDKQAQGSVCFLDNDPACVIDNEKDDNMILLVAYGGGHVAALAPVALALRQAGHEFIFLALTTASAHLQRLGIPSIGFKDLPGAADADVTEYGAALARDLPPGGVVAHEETVAYLGLSYRDMVHEYGEEGAKERYRMHGRQAFLPVRTLKSAIQAYRPSLVIATNSPRAERAAIFAAGECKVPSICVVDLFAVHEIEWVGKPGYADRVCVLNEEVRQRLIAYGRKPEEVLVTGNPAFDRLCDPAVIQAGVALRSERGWNDGRITILWASNIEPDAHPLTGEPGDPTLPRRIEAYLREFVATNPEYRLVVRYHPSERESFVPQPLVEFSASGENLAVLLHAVDVVVVIISTVGLEASLAGRPVLAVSGSVLEADAQYGEMGIATVVPQIAGTGDAIRAVAAGLPNAEGGLNGARLAASMATQSIVGLIKATLGSN